MKDRFCRECCMLCIYTIAQAVNEHGQGGRKLRVPDTGGLGMDANVCSYGRCSAKFVH